MTDLLHFPEPESMIPAEEPRQPPDHAARLRALDTHLSAIVEAPAGSGKTGLLLQRYLKLLADGGVTQPEEILAITFTRKATAELRERVVEQLHAAAENQPLKGDGGSFERETRSLANAVIEADRHHEWRLLDQPQRLRIRTIDALCAEIARALPLLSGSGTSQPMESAEPLYREAARRTLLELGGDDAVLNDALETVLLHRDGNLADCEALLARMLEHRQQWGDLIPLDADALADEHLDTQVRPRLERTLEAIVCAGLQRALDAIPDDAFTDLCELAASLGGEPSYHPAQPSPVAVWAGRTAPLEACAQDLGCWQALLHLLFTKQGEWRNSLRPSYLGFNISYEDGGKLKRLIQELQSDDLAQALKVIRSLPSPRFPDDQWRVAKALFRLLRHALAHLKVLFADRGQCDFSEFALAACEALSAEDGIADLARSPGARLTHLLVDEMQDTSSSQYTLLERLTRSWDGHSQTVFLVGDPKQSIYLFRQARVERFLRTFSERRLGDLPLVPLRLTANFRSQAALVHSFNDVFAKIFPQTATPAQAIGEEREVPFVHAHPVRDIAAHDESVVWHTEVLGRDAAPNQPKTSARELRAARMEREAREIRQIIEQWRVRPLPGGRTKPWSIAVLARARNHLTSITAELSRDRGNGAIPFRAVEIDRLNERPEVLDALALTRALLHPADRVAWLAVLRTPWCGLSLADLLRLTGEGRTADADATVAELVTGRGDKLSYFGQQLLNRVWPVLEVASTTLGRTPFAEHVERTWLSIGGDAALSQERLGNVRRFFEVLRDLEQEGTGYIDSSALNVRLSRLFAETSPDDTAVQLLTIHNSKGLEFDIVLVPGLERAIPRNRPDILNWLELDSEDGEAAHILLAPIHSRGEQSDGLNQWLSRVKHARESAETRRLLYVACTRAREVLHLFATAESDSRGALRRPADGTLLRAAWPVASSEFAMKTSPVEDLGQTADTPPIRSKVLPFMPAFDAADTLSLAAAGEELTTANTPLVHRLPLNFAPLERFTQDNHLRLAYIPSSDLPRQLAFDRPEGSFAVRAFGNVVHRFLQLLASFIRDGQSVNDLLNDLPGWEARLNAALRNEGLPPALAQREAARALEALHNTLIDPIGRWILAANDGATSERAIALADSSELRADRTFYAGPAPLLGGSDFVWIIDFKTTEQGSRSAEQFQEQELLKYRAQLERYAAMLGQLLGSSRTIKLGLYYPLVPRLLRWST